VGPSGVLYLIEDGPGVDYLRALLPDGTLLDIARNAASDGELAGCCFSPDGSVLFANLQEDGLTVAIRGPFPG
jgi:secreted PhoX family phosphatase